MLEFIVSKRGLVLRFISWVRGFRGCECEKNEQPPSYRVTREFNITVIIIPGINFGMTLHSLYCKYFSAENMSLYIT